jgi:mevalonate pyrophosphate decarboxylase
MIRRCDAAWCSSPGAAAGLVRALLDVDEAGLTQTASDLVAIARLSRPSGSTSLTRLRSWPSLPSSKRVMCGLTS